MSGEIVCVEVNGVFYESASCAGRVFKCKGETIKNRCLSNKFPYYKIVPFRITYTEKQCTVCKKTKTLGDFYVSTNSKDGVRAQCKKCVSQDAKERHLANPEKRRERGRVYRENNPKKVKRSRKEWEKNNPDKNKENKKKWKEDNPEYYREYSREWGKERRKNDPMFALNQNISRGIRLSLRSKKNGAHWEDLVGWTVEECKAHLESLFTEGMTWNNYGNGKYQWSLDHRIPISKWNITSVECQELKDCWSLDNLQPLWHTRNIEKGNKPMHPKYLIKPF